MEDDADTFLFKTDFDVSWMLLLCVCIILAAISTTKTWIMWLYLMLFRTNLMTDIFVDCRWIWILQRRIYLQLSCASQGYLCRILKCQMAIAQTRHTVIGEVVQEKQRTLHFGDFHEDFNKRFVCKIASFFFFSNTVRLSQEPSHTLPYQRLCLSDWRRHA